MLRLASYDIVFQEVPGEVTLALNLSGCPNRCPGCHSPHLREDIGEILDEELLGGLLGKYGGSITCVCFMGGDNDPPEVAKLAGYIRKYYGKAVEKDIGVRVFPEDGSNGSNCSVIGSKERKNMECGAVRTTKENTGGNSPVGRSRDTRHHGSGLKTAWYSGRPTLPEDISPASFDFIKLGPYIGRFGGLRSETTNQRFYEIYNGHMEDITHIFRKDGKQ